MLKIRCTPTLIRLMRDRSLELRITFFADDTLLSVWRLDNEVVRFHCTHSADCAGHMPDDETAVDITNGLLTLEACLEAGVDAPEKL